MIFIGWAIGGPTAGWLSDKIRRRRLPLMVGSFTAALLIAIVLYVPQLPPAVVYSLLLIFGVFSGAEVIVFAVGRENSPEKLAGTAIALTNTFVMLGGVIFQPFIGWLLDQFWDGTIVSGIPFYSTLNYQYALSVLPIGLIIGGCLTFFLKETHGRPQG